MKKSIKFNDAFGRLRSVTASLALLSLCTFAHAGANIGGKIFLSSCAGCHGASEDVPGFAPDLRRSHDIELGYRLERHGLSVAYLPQAVGFQDERKGVRELAADAERSGVRSAGWPGRRA